MNDESQPAKVEPPSPLPAEVETAECAVADQIVKFADLWHFATTHPLEGDVWEGIAQGICDAREALPFSVVVDVANSVDWPGFPRDGLTDKPLLASAAEYRHGAVDLFVDTPNDWHNEVKSPEYLIAYLREYAERVRAKPEIERSARAVLEGGWTLEALESTATSCAAGVRRAYERQPEADDTAAQVALADRLELYIAERALAIEKAKAPTPAPAADGGSQ